LLPGLLETKYTQRKGIAHSPLAIAAIVNFIMTCMSDYDSVLAAAVELPVDDRLRLIDELAASVPDDRPPALSPEWLAEIARRSDELDAGTVQAEPWPQVRERLRRKAGLDRAD
jgi:putative addiction module component (TIGR02574 family)